MVAQYIADGAHFALVAVPLAQQTRVGIVTAVGEDREIQGHHLEMRQVVDDILHGFIRIQPHPQAAVTRFERMGMLAPQAEGHYQVVAVGQAVQRGILVKQVPGFVDDLVVLNDSLHRRAL
ncbi:hypothetical protein D3C77_652040 [compost metagenome]